METIEVFCFKSLPLHWWINLIGSLRRDLHSYSEKSNYWSQRDFTLHCFPEYIERDFSICSNLFLHWDFERFYKIKRQYHCRHYKKSD